MRKIKAHYIFDGECFHKFGTLVLDENNTVISIIPFAENEVESEGVEFYSGILCPGFINAHCHLELSHLHNQIPQHTGLLDFISQVVSKRNLFENREIDMIKADETMYNEGIVAVGDISNNDESFVVKQKSKILYHSFIELFDVFSESKNIFNQGKELFRKLQEFKVSLSPHAPYSTSRVLFERIAEHAIDHEYPITIHNQEHISENEMFEKKSGELFDFFQSKGADFSRFYVNQKTSLQTYSSWLPLKNHILFVHNVHTTNMDLNFLKSIRSTDSFTFVICPLSNQYISNDLPPLRMLLNRKIKVAIGTDSLASNSVLSIISELYCLQQNFPEISLQILLQCATKNGARALGLQNYYGSFKSGKKPGVILLENVDLQNLKLQNNSKVRVLV